MFGRKKNEETVDETVREDDLTRVIGDSDVSVVRHEERLVADAQKQVTGHVRVSKRLVSEERTVTVTVEHEELVVEHLDADGNVIREEAHAEAGTRASRNPFRRGTHPAKELVLYGDDIEIVKHRRPLERVKIYVDAQTEDHTVTDDVRREYVEVEQTDGVRTDLRDGVATDVTRDGVTRDDVTRDGEPRR